MTARARTAHRTAETRLLHLLSPESYLTFYFYIKGLRLARPLAHKHTAPRSLSSPPAPARPARPFYLFPTAPLSPAATTPAEIQRDEDEERVPVF